MQSPMQVPASPPTGMPPQPPMYGAPPPPVLPSRRLPLIIAVVVVIVIVVLAAMYLLFFASGKPTVQFGAPIDFGSGFAVQVVSVSQAFPPSSYRVNLLADGVAGTAVPMALYMNLTVSAVAYQAVWVDLNADGRLTAGDGFGVIRAGGPLPASTYTFQLLWSDGSVVGSATFRPSGGGRPVVTFTSPSASATGFGFDVAGVSQTLSASNYEVALEVNATLSTPVTLAASMSFTVGADTYTIDWTDLGGEGDFTGGDAFDVARAGGLPPATTFTFYLIWGADGSTIATLSYTT